MAATFSNSPLKFSFILVLLKYLLLDDYHYDAYAFTGRYTSFQSFIRIRRGAFKPNKLPARPLSSWSKHGYTCIYLPSTTDITICMDVELNPGPVISLRSAHNLLLSQADHSTKSGHGVEHVGIWPVSPVHRFVYSRTDLLRLCPLHFDVSAWNRPRNWEYRGKRAGRLSKVKEARGALSISTIVCPRTLKNTRLLNNPHRKSVNQRNVDVHDSTISDDFTLICLLDIRKPRSQEKFWIPKLGNFCKFSQIWENIGIKQGNNFPNLGKIWNLIPPFTSQLGIFLGKKINYLFRTQLWEKYGILPNSGK